MQFPLATLNKKSQLGYTLVELMIALTLGAILTGGLIQVFQGSKKSYKFSSELSRMQENARYALDLIAHDIRLIGYQGCADPESIVPNVIANPPPANSFTVSGMQGFKVTSGGITPTGTFPALYTDGSLTNHASTPQAFDISAYALPHTDMIMMQFMSPVGVGVTRVNNGDSAQIVITNNDLGFHAGSYLIVSDCQSADVFRANSLSNNASGGINVPHSSGADSVTGIHYNTGNKLSKIYGSDAQIMQMVTNLYFVAPSGKDREVTSTKTDTRGDSINSLYRADIDNRVTELVQGVDAMVLLYGEKLASGNIHYYSADNAALDMSKVKSIKVGLLMHSIEAISDDTDTKTYTVAGTDFAPSGTISYNSSDHRMRRVFSETVNLRNRR